MALKSGTVTIGCAAARSLDAVRPEPARYRVAVDHGRSLLPVGAPAPLGVRRVSGPRAANDRVPVDGHAEDRAVQVRRLVASSATVLDEHEGPGPRWTVLADPDGYEFGVGG
ncbi:MAG: VOC family protein [Catenulispora sp.]